MSGGYPVLDYCNGQSASTIWGVAPTPNASANTKGAWLQLVASTAYDTQFICVELVLQNTTATGMAYDIGIGGAGSEVVLIPDLYAAFVSGASEVFLSIDLPFIIPAGTRISTRCQSKVASMTAIGNVNLQLFDSGFSMPEGYSDVDTIGYTSGTTLGTSVTPGASGAKGSYAQLIASTARDYAGFFVSFNQNSASNDSAIDIAVGAAASEKIIIADIKGPNTGTGQGNQWMNFFPIPVPAGQRLSARVADNGSDVTIRRIVLYGVSQ